MKLSGAQIKKVCPKVTLQDACEWATAFNNILPLYGMDNPDIFHEYIARVAVETGELTSLSENLNYSVEGLLKTFGRHRITREQAEQYGRKAGQKADQQKLANILYGGTFGVSQLGNTQPNDGWEFIGGGLLQLTGRRMYTYFTRYYNNRFGTSLSMKEISELVRTNKEMAVHSSCWVFAIDKKLIPYAINDDLEKVVRRIVGSADTLPKTEHYYKIAKQIVK